ncbi:Glycerol dehydrogenase OS=Streptomyces antimycoticus OX=68175 GN=SANT12839_076250 PE=4 SV=1 [Streptomyces antimycoticus]
MAEVLHRHGLPVLPEEIGFTVDEFVQIVEFAPKTRPGRYTILEHLDLSTDAIRDAYADYAKAVSQAISG